MLEDDLFPIRETNLTLRTTRSTRNGPGPIARNQSPLIGQPDVRSVINMHHWPIKKAPQPVSHTVIMSITAELGLIP